MKNGGKYLFLYEFFYWNNLILALLSMEQSRVWTLKENFIFLFLSWRQNFDSFSFWRPARVSITMYGGKKIGRKLMKKFEISEIFRILETDKNKSLPLSVV